MDNESKIISKYLVYNGEKTENGEGIFHGPNSDKGLKIYVRCSTNACDVLAHSDNSS